MQEGGAGGRGFLDAGRKVEPAGEKRAVDLSLVGSRVLVDEEGEPSDDEDDTAEDDKNEPTPAQE